MTKKLESCGLWLLFSVIQIFIILMEYCLPYYIILYYYYIQLLYVMYMSQLLEFYRKTVGEGLRQGILP